MPESYASIADVKTLNGEFSTSRTDEQITETLRVATQRIDAATKNHFGNTLVTMELSGDNTNLLKTSQMLDLPLRSVEAVRYRVDYAKSYSWESQGELIDADTYDINGDRVSILRIQGDIRSRNRWNDIVWIKGYKNYWVKAYVGSVSVPEPVRWATVLLAREMITPGSSKKFSIPLSEAYPDGYSITTRSTQGSDAAATGVRLLGIPWIDDILAPFARNKPVLIREMR